MELPDFQQDAKPAIHEEVEHKLVGQQASLVYELVELVHTHLRAYGQRHGYDVEPAIESFGRPQVDRSGNRISVTVGWNDEQMGRWEWGIDSFTMPGKTPNDGGVLSFVWEDPPQWVREEFDRARSTGGQFKSGWRVFLPETDEADHPGIPESRAIRDSLNGLRRLLQA